IDWVAKLGLAAPERGGRLIEIGNEGIAVAGISARGQSLEQPAKLRLTDAGLNGSFGCSSRGRRNFSRHCDKPCWLSKHFLWRPALVELRLKKNDGALWMH